MTISPFKKKLKESPPNNFFLKGYDVLNNVFFIDEYDGFYQEPIFIERMTFDSFSSFFEYVKDYIYSNTCLYGYKISEEERKKFGINDVINFTSFTHDKLSNYTYEKNRASKRSKTSIPAINAREMKSFVKNCKLPKTYKDLKKQISSFNKLFPVSENILFSFLFQKFGQKIKDVSVQYVLKYGFFSGISFGDILVNFGKDSIQYVIDHYNPSYSEQTIKKHKRNFLEALSFYQNGDYHLSKTLYFSEFNHLYTIRTSYVGDNFDNPILFTNDHYFVDFKDFCSYLKNDLSGCDLRNAPLDNIDFSKFKTDKNTIFPLPKTYETYKIEKIYYGNKATFEVKQKWFGNNGEELTSLTHEFHYFFDFVSFLNGDLSDSDLVMCNGIGNIKNLKGLKIDGIKVRSDAANTLGLRIEKIVPKISKKPTKEIEKNELITAETLLSKRDEEDEGDINVSYVTDIHLNNRYYENKCESIEDCVFVNRKIVDNFCEQRKDVILIGGDLSEDINDYSKFIDTLKNINVSNIFLTLGNHEFWPFQGKTVKEIVEYYRKLLNSNRMKLVHNNLFIGKRNVVIRFEEVKSDELCNMSDDELKEKCRDASLIIFGGVGFSGLNEKFNANNGIYNGVITREQEIEESELFHSLYKKVARCLNDKNVIIFTHMPFTDWANENERVDGFVYVSGHNHKNYFFDDGKTRIYADNQIGYTGKEVNLKTLYMSGKYDWFSSYKDGIYEINRKDYINFYRGIQTPIMLNRAFDKIFMLKRDKTYMFIAQNEEKLYLLNGGAKRRIYKHNIHYFYDNMVNYSKSVELFLSEYTAFQKDISRKIKEIGGIGRIHGCIVDIDYFDHLYVNPFDKTVVPYFARSMTFKDVYPSLERLLKENNSYIYHNYVKMIEENSNSKLTLIDERLPKITRKTHVTDTYMYSVSRTIKNFQYISENNVIRVWNDSVVEKPSEENGKQIVLGMLQTQDNTKKP